MSDREAQRHKRLREALRENLKRRKNQSRGRAAMPQVDSEADAATAPNDDRQNIDRQDFDS